MSDLLRHDLSEDLLQELQKTAAAHGLSAAEEAKRILNQVWSASAI